MNYTELSKQIETLGYRDKFRLAQLLIQLARKEEEEQKPQNRASAEPLVASDPELISYVSERLMKLKPSKKEAVLNSIGAMFQFQGGISQGDREKIFAELLKHKHILIGENDRINYPK